MRFLAIVGRGLGNLWSPAIFRSAAARVSGSLRQGLCVHNLQTVILAESLETTVTPNIDDAIRNTKAQ